MKFHKDSFEILRKINKQSNISQRIMAKELNMSIGKLNYCLKELQKKGLVKIKNFKKHPNKLGYVYLLTPKGILEKTKITVTRLTTGKQVVVTTVNLDLQEVLKLRVYQRVKIFRWVILR